MCIHTLLFPNFVIHFFLIYGTVLCKGNQHKQFPIYTFLLIKDHLKHFFCVCICVGIVCVHAHCTRSCAYINACIHSDAYIHGVFIQTLPCQSLFLIFSKFSCIYFYTGLIYARVTCQSFLVCMYMFFYASGL